MEENMKKKKPTSQGILIKQRTVQRHKIMRMLLSYKTSLQLVGCMYIYLAWYESQYSIAARSFCRGPESMRC